jgi:hypothetical protein
MMTEQVDPEQIMKRAATVENGHKAVQEAVKLVKQLSETVDKLRERLPQPNAKSQ